VCSSLIHCIFLRDSDVVYLKWRHSCKDKAVFVHDHLKAMSDKLALLMLGIDESRRVQIENSNNDILAMQLLVLNDLVLYNLCADRIYTMFIEVQSLYT